MGADNHSFVLSPSHMYRMGSSRRTRARVTAVLPKGCEHMFLDDRLEDQSLNTGTPVAAIDVDPTLVATRAPRSRRRICMSWVAIGALALTGTESPRRASSRTVTRTAPHRPDQPPEPWAAAVATVATRATPHNAAGLARSASDAANDEWALAGGGVHGGLS